MSDFYQNGVVTVLHRLGQPNVDQLERELARYGRVNPIALVLPSLYAELGRPALKAIVESLKHVSYLNEIVISLDRASALEFRLAKQFFSVLPQRVRLIWNDGARIQSILKLLVDHNLDIGLQGKGRGCWTAFGYVLARNQSQVIALHDCDITSYDREYLARLCYPIANPNLGYEFCKGYYSRVTDRLHGRVTRLFITPMIRSLQQLVGPHALLTFLDSFRYPLAGEFAMVRDLAWTNRIPGDWGLRSGCSQRSIGTAPCAAFAKPILPMPMTTNTRRSRITIPMPASLKCASISPNRSLEIWRAKVSSYPTEYSGPCGRRICKPLKKRSAAMKTTRPLTASPSTGTKNGQPSKSS